VPHPTHTASPATRRRPGLAAAASRLENLAGVLGIALAYWADRDQATDRGAARSAADTACDAIDNALAVLHTARRQLAAEVAAHDEAMAAMVDALLALAPGRERVIPPLPRAVAGELRRARQAAIARP
jgi:hypothetical protein